MSEEHRRLRRDSMEGGSRINHLHPASETKNLPSDSSEEESLDPAKIPERKQSNSADSSEEESLDPANIPERKQSNSADSSEEESLDPANIPERERSDSVIPKYRMVNFERFKNWYDGDERYAIDAYVAKSGSTSQLQDDIRQERERRRQSKATRFNQKLRESSSLFEQQYSIVEDDGILPKGSFIQRVRIESQPVLQYLIKCCNAADGETRAYASTGRVTFVRPFRMLIFFHGKMKEALNVLEDKWADLEKQQSKKDLATSPTNVSIKQADDTSEREDVMDSISALQHMRCYVSFVEEHIMPISRFMKGGEEMRTVVRFDDLWLLFKPGQNIISTSKERIVAVGEYNRRYVGTADRDTKKLEPYQHVWRIASVTTPPDRLDDHLYVTGAKHRIAPPSVIIQDDPDQDKLARMSFQIRCFYLDYDGSSWQPVFTRFSIAPYDDEIDVTSLSCYPLQFHEDSERILTDLAAMGERFQNALTEKRFYYSGITLERTPDGDALFKRERDNVGGPNDTHNRHLPFKRPADLSGKLIESEVVVDFEETYMNSPSLRPKFIPLRNLKIHKHWDKDRETMLPLQVWDSVDRNKLLRSEDEHAQLDDPVSALEAEQWIDSTSTTSWHTQTGMTMEAYNARHEELEGDGKTTGRFNKGTAVLKKDDLVLTPTRVCGYAFKEKGFFMLDLRKLQPIIRQKGLFESLKIPREYKEMVRSLVSSHFEKKRIERLLSDRSEGSIDQDIIQGKGKGLVILLHGVPGVGKTATAEAVAKENQKPLFTVTYGDLGTNPSVLEETLENLFHLASRWDCILLFDEADVFLAERSRTELKRNALVSVFLRVLEYYHGILFLTTNRVGSIDEAFKSRLHIMLYYPPLGRKQTLAIFEANIAKLKEIEKQRQLVVDTPPLMINEDSIMRFAERHFDSNLPDGGRWNGRQIKNAFQIAASMAHYKAEAQISKLESRVDGSNVAESEAPVQPVLDETHFKKVEKATEDFGQYITQARGFNDAKWAKMSSLRNDEFQPSAAPGPGHHFAARGAAGGYGGYGGAGPGVDSSYQHDGSFHADDNNYHPYKGASNGYQGQAGYDKYGAGQGGAYYPPGGHQNQPRFQDPYLYHNNNSGQMGHGPGSMPSRSPVPMSTASPHGPTGPRPAPSREDFGIPQGQRGGNYDQRYPNVPRPVVHGDDAEDVYD